MRCRDCRGGSFFQCFRGRVPRAEARRRVRDAGAGEAGRRQEPRMGAVASDGQWRDELSPTPFVPMVTVKAGGHEIDACAGFTELFIDNGKDKNLTNCEIYGVGKKNAKIVCGELAALIGYIPGVKIEIDERSKTVKISVSKNASN